MSKKKYKKTKKYINNFLVASGILFWISVGGLFVQQNGFDFASIFELESSSGVSLDKCVDGDTAWFNIDGTSTKVRFLYVDTPESTNKTEPYGKEASSFTCELLSNASEIELEYDGDKTDKYGRTLAWIYVIDKNGNKVFVQEELAKNGYVKKFYDYGDYKYENTIINAVNDKYNIFEQ